VPIRLPRPLPFETALGAIDNSAKMTAGTARDHTVAAARRILPAHSGRLRSATRGRVQRTPIGYLIRVAPVASVRYPNGVTAVQVARWVAGGTGIHGPRKRAYTPRRADAFRLPSGWRTTTIEGQAAQDPYERVQSGEDARVERILGQGAFAAARAAERVLGGRR
jgi:hypothetical protein